MNQNELKCLMMATMIAPSLPLVYANTLPIDNISDRANKIYELYNAMEGACDAIISQVYKNDKDFE